MMDRSQNVPCGVSTRQKNPHLRIVSSGFFGARSLPDPFWKRSFLRSQNVPRGVAGDQRGGTPFQLMGFGRSLAAPKTPQKLGGLS